MNEIQNGFRYRRPPARRGEPTPRRDAISSLGDNILYRNARTLITEIGTTFIPSPGGPPARRGEPTPRRDTGIGKDFNEAFFKVIM